MKVLLLCAKAFETMEFSGWNGKNVGSFFKRKFERVFFLQRK